MSLDQLITHVKNVLKSLHGDKVRGLDREGFEGILGLDLRDPPLVIGRGLLGNSTGSSLPCRLFVDKLAVSLESVSRAIKGFSDGLNVKKG